MRLFRQVHFKIFFKNNKLTHYFEILFFNRFIFLSYVIFDMEALELEMVGYWVQHSKIFTV